MNYGRFGTGIIECRCSPLLLKIEPKDKFHIRDSATNKEIKLKLKESAEYHEKNLIKLNKEYEQSVLMRQYAESSVLKVMKKAGALKDFEMDHKNSPCGNKIRSRSGNRVMHFSLQLKDFRQKEREKIEEKRRRIKARIILDKIRINNAAKRIQIAWRKYLARAIEYEKLRKKVRNAAVAVQSHFRGFLIRKSLKKIKDVVKAQINEKDSEDDVNIEDKKYLEEKSALKIQKFWKMKYNRLRNSTLSLENSRIRKGSFVIASIEATKLDLPELKCEKVSVPEEDISTHIINNQVKEKGFLYKPLKTKSKLGICKCKCIKDLYRDSVVRLSHPRKVNNHKKPKSRFPDIQKTIPGLKTSLLNASLDFIYPEW